jgi:hypothetical protein
VQDDALGKQDFRSLNGQLVERAVGEAENPIVINRYSRHRQAAE